MTPTDELDRSIQAARHAFLDLFSLMVTYELDFVTLSCLLTWPPPISTAHDFWNARMAEVVNELARRQGIPIGTLKDSDPLKLRLIETAYKMVMD